MSNILYRVDNKSMRRCNFKEHDYKNRSWTIISKIAGDTVKEAEYAITPTKRAWLLLCYSYNLFWYQLGEGKIIFTSFLNIKNIVLI